MATHAIILCATPRSGSTLLCDLMRGTGVLGRPQSWYRRQSMAGYAARFGVGDGPDFDAGYLAAVRSEGTDDSGTFAIRLMWDHFECLRYSVARLFPDPSGERAQLEVAFGPAQFVFLSRVDKVAQAVSRLRAEQSGLWHRAADGRVREQVGEFAAPQYDAAALAAYIAEADADEALWRAWFRREGAGPVNVTYEALADNPKVTLAALLAALHRDPLRAEDAEVGSQKLADADSLDWAVRFRRERG